MRIFKEYILYPPPWKGGYIKYIITVNISRRPHEVYLFMIIINYDVRLSVEIMILPKFLNPMFAIKHCPYMSTFYIYSTHIAAPSDIYYFDFCIFNGFSAPKTTVTVTANIR